MPSWEWEVLVDPKDEIPELEQRVVVYAHPGDRVDPPIVRDASEAAALLGPHSDLDREAVWVIILRDGMLVGVYTAHVGATDHSFVDVSVILRVLIACGSDECYVVHNHPSGDGRVSNADTELKGRVEDALGLFNIKLGFLVIPRGLT